MLVLIDAVSVFLGVAAMRLAWRVIMATYSGWFAFRMEPVGYVKMFVFVLIGYLLVLGLDFRRISPSPSRRSVTSANRSSEAMVMSAISRAMAAPDEMAMPASASEKENAASAAHKKPQVPFGICVNIHVAACRQTRLGRIRLRYRCTQQISSTTSSASQENG